MLGHDEFEAYHPKVRGVSRHVGFTDVPVHRGSTHGFAEPSFDDVPSTLMHKDAAFVDTTEERPPSLPYSWEVCSSNTFTCTDFTVAPQALREKLMHIIRKTPADISCNSDWEFNGVFYPQELKTVFKVSIFDNGGQKNSCLIEMQLQEGDRVAFQGLCSYVQSQADLVYAFADEWGFDETEELDNEWEGGYQHRSLGPLPLPSSLLSKLNIETEEFSPFSDDATRGGNSLVDMLLENTCSPFADVRRTGWQELAKATNEGAAAEALLKARVNGEECISLATSVLQQSGTCDVTADTQRCVLKTLLNVARTGTAEACRKICSLKTQIITLASDDKDNAIEMRVIAVQLMQCLVGNSASVDKDFVSAIRARSHGKCRVSEHARQALTSLKLVPL